MRRPLGLSMAETLTHFGVPLHGADGCVQPRQLNRPHRTGYWCVGWAGRSSYLHRLILEWKIGVRPLTAVQARHTCGHKWCVNPAHIISGSILDNMADQYRLGERVMNERHPQCRLSSADAVAIREAPHAESSAALAIRFGLSTSYVNQIRAGTRRRFAA